MMQGVDMSKGMHWIGHPGSLHPIIDSGGESSQPDVDNKVSVSMGGTRRVRVSRKRAPRSWSLSMPNAHHDQVEAVETLMTATLPPYVLVTAGAQTSNVLTPERSTLLDSSPMLGPAGSWPLEGGGFSTLTRTNPSAAFGYQARVTVGPCPTPPVWTARPVTVSAWLGTARAAGASVSIQWLDAAGAPIGSEVVGNAATGMDMLRRSTATGLPPSGAVACNVAVDYAELAALPQVTWTAAPIQEWSVGRGADQVVISGFGNDTTWASPHGREGRMGDYSLSLMEVGP